MNYYGYNDYRNYLAHHGVKGMKWGVRKQRATSGLRRQRRELTPQQKAQRKAKIKTYAKRGAIVAGVLLASYGAYKIHNKKVLNNRQVAQEIVKKYEEAKKITPVTQASIIKPAVSTTPVFKIKVSNDLKNVDAYTQELLNKNSKMLDNWEKYFR